MNFVIFDRFRMNLGQEGTWYPPPQGYNYVQQVPEKVKSMDAPEKKNECEVRGQS
jgi:hypothetical protein